MDELPSSTRKWIGGSILVAVLVTVYLFWNPERGANTAAILSLTLTIVSTALAVHAANRMGQQAAASPWRHYELSGPAKFWTGAVLAVALLVPASAWVWNRWFADLDVRFPAAVEVREDQVSAVTPDVVTGWQGGELVFTPSLAALSDLSDCVIPAVLHVEPKLDGRSGTVIAARHDVPVSINIPDGTRRVDLGLKLEAPGDQNCVVSATFGHGELRR
ncbi:hypothetical protein [Actinoplanes derwentensis]|uniref:Uncharacterized protein n=1 Tax=Actinoplanes derwentensis TaxID=113562 RepID=A0A1H1ZVP7_9ACTN|nr:hypothetical protein [Actinoplanes derwentensis]GID83534.1 hypothetical protein Ade03nite_24580 [Actinoplanes derwentensis]SDT37462.1 hypothetical protein SAMN04489716_3510 [Actinoplanes derwentensis]